MSRKHDDTKNKIAQAALVATWSYEAGAAVRRSTWQAAFARATRDTGIDASTHDLRHYCASCLIAAGCSVTAVQHFLGHKNASETLDTDSHLWPDNEDKIRAPIDHGLGRREDYLRTGGLTGT